MFPAGIAKIFGGPALPPACRRTYRLHLIYVLLDAVAKGILANAPLMALKGMGSPAWQMALQVSISSAGLFSVLYLGGIMADRPKKPFFIVPGVLYALSTFAMSFTHRAAFFLILLGLGTLFEVVTRPSLTAVIRLSYPPTHRGAATGEIRKWYSLAFLSASIGSALLLDHFSGAQALCITGEIAFAALLSTVSLFFFGAIRIEERFEKRSDGPAALKPFVEAGRIVATDGRFRRYLAIAFLYAFGGLMYASFLPVFMARDLGFSYLLSSFLTESLPATLAFLSTGLLGRWMDRVSTWKAWSAIRLGWGCSALILAATPSIVTFFPDARVAMPFIARLLFGLVMGGSWILWWQVAVTHFAPPGADTTRYMGLIYFMNGIARLLGPLVGAFLLSRSSMSLLFGVGGGLVVLSALLSYREYLRETFRGVPRTIARFEEEAREKTERR